MVEINNQRKAFLDMLAWSEGNWITDVRKPEIMVRCHCSKESYLLITPITSQTCHAKPKLKSTGAGRYQLLSRCGMPTASSRPERLLSEKSDAVYCSRLRSVALYLWLIVVISVRQSTVAAISGLHCRALVMVSSSIRLTAWLQNGMKWRNGQRDWRMSRFYRDYLPRSGYLHHRLPVMAVNHYRDNAITYKAQRTKMPENWSWRTRQLLTCRCVSVMLLRSMQNTRRS